MRFDRKHAHAFIEQVGMSDAKAVNTPMINNEINDAAATLDENCCIPSEGYMEEEMANKFRSVVQRLKTKNSVEFSDVRA